MIAGLPSLSEIESTTVDHLTALANDLETEATLIETTFTQAHELMNAAPWAGQAHDAACARTDADRVIAVRAAAARREAAAAARSGAENMLLAKEAALRAASEAHSAAFEVRQDLAASAFTPGRPWEEAVRLQPMANEITTAIRNQAASMVAIDRDTTAKLAAAAAGLGNPHFTEAPLYATSKSRGKDRNHVRLVDNRTQKDAPPGDTSPTDPIGTDGGAGGPARIRGLPPEGLRPPVDGELTPGPASRPSERAVGGESLWDEKGGEWRYFPGDRWHNPHWDYNPHDRPNSGWENSPIGDLPHLKDPPDPLPPALTPPPADPPTPSPIVITPPELSPQEKGGLLTGGVLGGLWVILSKLAHPFSITQ